MNKIHSLSSGFFVLSVAILSLISILGVWDFFSGDVIMKSFQTLGLLAFISVVVIVSGRFIEGRTEGVPTIFVPNPIFKSIRQATLGVLIVSSALLALLGVLSIWEVITDKEVLFKSLSSLGIIAFASLIIVVTCLEREDSPLLKQNSKVSFGGVVIGAILLYIFLGSMFF